MKKLGRAILAVLIIILSTFLFVACDKGNKTNNYNVTIHQNNGQTDIIWVVTDEVPILKHDGFDLEGLYLDNTFTMQTSFEALKRTGIANNIDVYVKWIVHEHKFAENWSFDHEYHWKTAVCGHYVIEKKEKHVFLEGLCYICGIKESEEVIRKISFWVDGNKHTLGNVINNRIYFPEPPAKKGYSFDGWFFDENVWKEQVEESKDYDFDENEIDVYAKFSLDLLNAAPVLNEFTGAQKKFTLDTGWSVYTSSATKYTQATNVNSDVGYIESLNAFVVTNQSGLLSIIKCDDTKEYFNGGIKGMMFPESMGIRALRISNGMIACVLVSGDVCVYDYNANVLIPCGIIGSSDTRSDRFIGNSNIDYVLSILNGGIIAVNPKFDSNGIDGYISIYKSFNKESYGFCRIKSLEDSLTNIKCFDGQYLVVTNENYSEQYICSFSQSDFEQKVSIIPTVNGTVRDNGQDNYFSEITYLGNGKFFVYQDWTVDNSKDYKFFDGYNYYDFKRYTYIPKVDSIEQYLKNQDKVFFHLGNSYYGSNKSGIDTKTVLKNGYIFASHGITIINKIGVYDQFILDEDLNMITSLSMLYDEYSEKCRPDNKTNNYVSMILNHVKGISIDLTKYSETRVLFGGNGKFVDHNIKSVVTDISFTNNKIVACIEDYIDPKNKFYGAFNLDGEVVVPFKYLSLSAFRGSYTVGKAKNEDGVATWYIVGSDGEQITQMTDGSTPLMRGEIATNSKGSFIYKIGCYMYKVDTGEKDSSYRSIFNYGIKTFNPDVNKNIIMEATMSAGSVLYMSEMSNHVFVFDKVIIGDAISYTIYSLI